MVMFGPVEKSKVVEMFVTDFERAVRDVIKPREAAQFNTALGSKKPSEKIDEALTERRRSCYVVLAKVEEDAVRAGLKLPTAKSQG